MAIKWVNKEFTKTPEDARSEIRSNVGWRYTNDIIDYLNLFAISNYTIEISQIDSIQSEIDMGNIILLCLVMFYVTIETNTIWHIEKFYRTNKEGLGHFIIVKGYKIVDAEIYYEVYDPNSWRQKYNNGLLKGMDRYYRNYDLNNAVIN